MTDKRDYIIEITARKDPLTCFKMIEEQVDKGFSPVFGEKMLTHTNNPKIISMLAERTAAALAQGEILPRTKRWFSALSRGGKLMTIRAENCKKRLQPTGERRILTILTVCRSLLIATDGAVIFLTHGIWENAPIWPDGILPVIRVSVLLRKCGKLISLRRRIFRRQRLISAVAGICASCRSAVPTRGGRTR